MELLKEGRKIMVDQENLYTNCEYVLDNRYQVCRNINDAIKIRKNLPGQKILLVEGKKSSLMAAAERGHHQICQILMADENDLVNDANSMKAEHYAAMNGHWETYDLLVGAGKRKLSGKIAKIAMKLD